MEYKNCYFKTTEVGSFTPGELANPSKEEAKEYRIEILIPSHKDR